MLHNARRNGYIAIGRNHNIDFNASAQGSLECAPQMGAERQVGVDQRNIGFGGIDSLDKRIMNNTLRFIGITINHTNEFMAGRCVFVFF